MKRLTRSDVIRKCIMVFEAIRRMVSKGGAGLEAERGAADEFDMVDDCTAQLKEILREMEAGKRGAEEQAGQIVDMKDWQKDAENGPPERLIF